MRNLEELLMPLSTESQRLIREAAGEESSSMLKSKSSSLSHEGNEGVSARQLKAKDKLSLY